MQPVFPAIYKCVGTGNPVLGMGIIDEYRNPDERKFIIKIQCLAVFPYRGVDTVRRESPGEPAPAHGLGATTRIFPPKPAGVTR